MKIAYCSDLHLEHYLDKENLGLPESFLDNHGKADVLVLAGDILDCSVHYHDRITEFYTRLVRSYDDILCVMGNHEHYFGDFAKTAEKLIKVYGVGVRLLDNEGISLGGVRFFGGTKWTNFDNDNELAKFYAGRFMSDYRVIKNSNTRVSYRSYDSDNNVTFRTRDGVFSVDDAIKEQKAFLDSLEADMKDHPGERYFVISHHSPSFAMTSEEYVTSELNPAYHDSLENFILDRPNIKRWVHGHTHHKKTMQVGECSVLLNARGYPGEHSYRNFNIEFTDL